jgi:hypothetical protein
MKVKVVKKGRVRYVSGIAGRRLLKNIDDVIGLIGYCFEKKVNRVLLYTKNLTKKFFDLSSHEAGMILQKFRDYRIKLAVVLAADMMSKGKFGEMVAEENQGIYFHAFTNRQDAEEWLVH